jgi:fructose 1,6-bisphosphate aldolase/phosphatase
VDVTLSAIKADIGGWVGHSVTHPDTLARAEELMAAAKRQGVILDYRVMNCGDDLQLIMTHQHGEDSEVIHRLAWETFSRCTEVAKRLKLHGAGQDLLTDAFSGNVKGMGPGLAEMTVTEREAETVIVFMADKTASGAWNLPLFRMFADPFNTPGLVIAPNLHCGFSFEVHDVMAAKKIVFNSPEEVYDMLVYLGSPGHFAVKNVYHRDSKQIAASASTQKLSMLAGRYVGKDDPVLVVRCQGTFPAVGEVLEAFSSVNIVEGWMRGSHNGPLMPVGFASAKCTRFDGPPRCIAAGFQLANGTLIGPCDMFGDVAFDPAREKALQVADILRTMGPFEPHRLPLDQMEYTTMPEVSKRLAPRFVPIDDD